MNAGLLESEEFVEGPQTALEEFRGDGVDSVFWEQFKSRLCESEARKLLRKEAMDEHSSESVLRGSPTVHEEKGDIMNCPIRESEIAEAIEKLSRIKAAGPDEIGSEFDKLFSNAFFPTHGKSHFSTTASDDFKAWEQTEAVTRHLRPRRFDDPIYDVEKRRFKGRRKPYFPEENLRLEGPTSYKTTNSEAYKSHDTRGTAAAPRRPQSHEVFQKYTATEDELRRIKNGDKSKTHISLFGRKDSTELIAEIQGLLSPQGKLTVERPQPFRPTSNLKIRNEQCSTEMSTTTRETFKKVTPTARVKPIKREPCLRKLGEDDDPMPKTTTSGEAYCEVKIPPKPEPYRPSDNLKVTGEMTFSTTTQESFTSRSHRKNVEVVERTKPVKREAVVKDIIFPAPEAVSSPGSRGSGRKDDSAEVLRSVENVRERDSFTRLRKPSRDRPQTSQKVGEGEFHHVTSSMAEHQDRAAKHWKYSRVAELSGASTDECPAAFLNTDKSEYVFKEVIGEHRFYLPAVQ
ncbi:hypothetical protein IscW_ISCW003265 [Ixodes scapularis]|uniref:Uncharacterized protein n=1 Tax=Ixodes scapularis TaxID=6945 RepID=B7PAP9_IXOSC|nr:hypothetical protein IscW_ISCW003265 [Ixodes scapularis]|eukprot:XP_002407099.1 hypothetical protein IscW_ISCW003265 [Ixodes scapularis]